MDFQKLKRRQLQGLCKLNNIPANLTNAAMAHSLSILPSVEGLEEFLRDPTASDPGSPERSVISSPDVFQTSTRQKVTKEEPEGSKLATRTRCGTRRRVVEGTDARKTPATRTTRKRASQDAMVQKQMEKDLQADFEADMEQSEVSDNSGLLGELKEMSEDVSGVSVNYEEQFSLESQNGSKNEVYEVVNDVQDVFDVDDNKKNLENIDAAEVFQEEPTEMFNSSQKVNFYSFSRRDLQSLCKKNKIPANTTNSTMADALESLEIVEGLEEFLKECNSQAPHSPTMSEMTSSCARRSWTSRRINKEPTSSKLITKSCRGSRRKVIEEIDREKIALTETPEAGTIVCSSMDSVQKTEVQTYSKVGSITSAGKQSEYIEYPGEVNSDEGRLSVIEGEIDLLSQLEAAEIDSPESLDFVSDTGNSNGGSEVPEQLQNMDYQTAKHAHIVSSTDASKDTEVVNYGVDFGSISEDKPLENGNEGARTESEVSSDAGSEHGSDNSKFDNVDEVTNTEGADSGVFGDAGPECEPVEMCLVEKLEGAQEDQLSEKFDSVLTTLSDASKDTEVVNYGVEFGSESEVSSDAGSEHDSDSEVTNTEGSDSGVFSDAGPECEAVEMCLVEKLEDVQDQLSEKFDSELTTLAYQPPILVNNAEIGLVMISSDSAAQMCPVEQIESNTAEENSLCNDAALIFHPIEKFEADMSKKSDSELTILTDQCGAKVKQTPLDNKSLRKLKKMLKEKLQATISLSNKMENLTLEEKNDSLAEVEEVIDGECENLEGKSDELASSGVYAAPICADAAKQVRNEDLEDLTETIDVILADNHMGGHIEDSEANFDVNAADLCPFYNPLDNAISEDSTVHDDVEFNKKVTNKKVTSEKHLSITPSKMMKQVLSSPSKTPMSVGRMNHDSDFNKENIDHSASRTESAKVSDVRSGKIVSAMSMGKLKKALLQHSEKKRPALHTRSENYHPLASP